MLDRYQRRTTRLTGQAGEVVRRLAGRAGAGPAGRAWESRCRGTPRCGSCSSIPLPEVSIPLVLGIDDFALRRSHESTRPC